MEKTELTKEAVAGRFAAGIDCGQVVAEQFSAETGLPVELLRRSAACYAAGMMRGETCGAVIGAYNVIGMIYGQSEDGDEEQKGAMLTKMLRFNELFQETYEGFMCRELLDADISTKEGARKIGEENLLTEVCPLIVIDAVEALKRVIDE